MVNSQVCVCVCTHKNMDKLPRAEFMTKSDSAASCGVGKARKMGLGYLRLLGEKK